MFTHWSAGLSFAALLAITVLHYPRASAQIVPNRWILVLEDPPVSAKFPRREDLQGAQALAYRQQIEDKQAVMKRELESRNYTVTGSVSVLQNLIFVVVPPTRAGAVDE